jgi:hypothetical protein
MRLFLVCKVYLIVLVSLLSSNIFGQDYGGDKVGLANFVKRMYNYQPFEGIKMFQNQSGKNYIISAVTLKKTPEKSDAVMFRIASVKSKSYLNQLLNGSNVSSSLTITKIDEKVADSVISKTISNDIITESSLGFVNGMELLVNFTEMSAENYVYIFYGEINY